MLATAPLAKVSNRQFLKMARLLTARTTLWTEMITANTVLHGSLDQVAQRNLASPDVGGPRVVQLASSDPDQLEAAMRLLISSRYGGLFDEVNLNCGCPAESAGAGAHGAFLLRLQERDRLRRLCDALVRGAGKNKDVSIKIRTGVAGEVRAEILCLCVLMASQSSVEALLQMVEEVAIPCGVGHVILHARDAILTGRASTKDNLRVPPLRRDWGEQLRARVGSRVRLTYNGEVKSMQEARALVDAGYGGVMMGRRIIDYPFDLSRADEVVFGVTGQKSLSREELALQYAAWLEFNMTPSDTVSIAPMMNLFAGAPAAKHWKKALLQDHGLVSPPRRIRNALAEVSKA
jgi:tRNA-dihydrouridine synthase A